MSELLRESVREVAGALLGGPLTSGEIRRRSRGRFADRTIRDALGRLRGARLVASSSDHVASHALTAEGRHWVAALRRHAGGTNAAAMPPGGEGGSLTPDVPEEIQSFKEAAAAAIDMGSTESGTRGGIGAARGAAFERREGGIEAALIRLTEALGEQLVRKDELVNDLVAELDEKRRELAALRGASSPAGVERVGRVDKAPSIELTPELSAALAQRRREKEAVVAARKTQPPEWASWERGTLEGLARNPDQVTAALKRASEWSSRAPARTAAEIGLERTNAFIEEQRRAKAAVILEREASRKAGIP